MLLSQLAMKKGNQKTIGLISPDLVIAEWSRE